MITTAACAEVRSAGCMGYILQSDPSNTPIHLPDRYAFQIDVGT